MSAPSDDKNDGEPASQSNESTDDPEHKVEDDKRLYGSVLSSGWKFGKKDAPSSDDLTRYDIKEDFKKWYYGSILGKGFKSGKRYYDTDNSDLDMINDKRGIDSIDQDIEAVDLEGPIDDKRWVEAFRGTYHGRRIRRDAIDKRFIHYFGRGYVVQPRLRRNEDENEEDSDEKFDMEDIVPYIQEAEQKEEDEANGDINSDINEEKRYFWTAPGYRFDFGKRYYGIPDDSEYLDNDVGDRYPIEKRLFGNVLGRGFAFGKRRYLAAHKKRPFGYLLGKGFSFGKRTNEDSLDKRNGGETSGPYYLPGDDEDLDMDKRPGWLLGRGFKLGKRGSKRFGWILGRGLKFGKRSGDASPIQPDYFIDDFGHVEGITNQVAAKRFGHVLGSGFVFGKRNVAENLEYVPDKRGFGFVLGRGFRLGKR